MHLSNRLLRGALAGLAGTACVNVLHETTRRLVPHAPRVDIVGMRAFRRLCIAMGMPVPDHLRAATFAGDVVANSLYYGLVGAAGNDRAVVTGTLLGAAGGAGAVLLPRPMGLGNEEINRTAATTAMTVAMYLAGGLVAGLTYRSLAQD